MSDAAGPLILEMHRIEGPDKSPMQMISAELLAYYRHCAILCARTVVPSTAMPLSDPLTLEQLRDIGKRKDPADIPALLWEIKRLQILILRVDQVQQGATGGGGIIWDVLRGNLDREPCVLAERERKRKAWDDVYEPGDDGDE
ncbi:hypothetical protein BN2497_2505 [Janthinobacterium sp. CG23_2]|nr:hypothetical protein BN2497_2505 [Janthinobacterium sp. CG23_2]CUU27650.1 hypothetical protein BN3177_2505 [Janthinobacterium sp. CG23_2]